MVNSGSSAEVTVLGSAIFWIATGWKAKPLASALLQDAGVAVIGGPDFGVHGEGYLRLSYANSLENIKRALERMQDFLSRPARAAASL